MGRIREQNSGGCLYVQQTGSRRIKWRICVYIRLSKEDTRNVQSRGKNDKQIRSESIKNQESILKTWIERYFMDEDYEIVDFFSEMKIA